MTWINYMVTAAQHSKGSASHWFRYLSKDIEKCGAVFSKQDVEELSNSDALTFFQRISLRAAFEEGSPTRQHIISLNKKIDLSMVTAVRNKLRGNVE